MIRGPGMRQPWGLGTDIRGAAQHGPPGSFRAPPPRGPNGRRPGPFSWIHEFEPQPPTTLGVRGSIPFDLGTDSPLPTLKLPPSGHSDSEVEFPVRLRGPGPLTSL